jgi:hypothetical protein
MSYLNEIKAYMRDINLDILMNCPDVKIDISKRYNNKFRLFYPSRELIKYTTNIGGVLVGSRAIRCFTIDGKPILDRRVSDWDFIVTLDMAFKICDDMGIEEIPQIDGVISIKNQRRWAYPDYQDTYRVGPVDVQLIVKDELPDYTEIDGVRIANFGYSISQKIGMTTDLQSKLTGHNRTQASSRYDSIDEQYHKHISDLREMIIKFNSLKWKQPV